MLAARDFTQEMDSDLMAFDDFFGAADDLPDDLWSITRPQFGDDADMLDADDLQLLEGEDDKSKLGGSNSNPTSPAIKAEPLPSPTRDCCKPGAVKEEAPREPSLAERRKALLSSASPALLSSPRTKRRISEATMASEYEESDVDAEHHECDGHGEAEDDDDDEEDDGDFFLDDVDYENLQLLSDEDVAALVPSPMNTNATNSLIASLPIAKLVNAKDDAMSRAAPVSSTNFTSANQSSNSSATVSDHDIPDVVNLFNSLYSPSASPTRVGQYPAVPSKATAVSSLGASAPNATPAPLRIVVPAPTAANGPVVGTSTMPTYTQTSNGAVVPTNRPGATSAGGVFDYFTPQGYAPNAQQSHPSLLLAAADSMSPALKASLLQGQMNAAAAVAMANSAAALNTIRKLNTTYGVPIAPLQRSLTTGELPLKPKLATASSVGAIGKVTKISITPDIADFKLVQIFHNFCDPMTKMLTLPRFHQLLLHHQVKEDSPGSSPGSKTPGRSSVAISNAPGAIAPPVAAPVPPVAPSGPGFISAEAQHLFRLMDPTNSGFVDLERFMSSFQICNRCTEAKRRANSAMRAQQGQSFVPPTALERQLMEDVAPVIVRVVPTKFEGSKVKSCEHYQWTWCEGFDKTGNEKCRGTNRHDKCPKYLANCTLWKHKLPPKTRKPRATAVSAPEVLDSPSKKLKHFG